MIFKRQLEQILPKSPKNKLLLTMGLSLLANAILGVLYICWLDYTIRQAERNGGHGYERARDFDISFAGVYLAVNSVTFYALQDWVFAEGSCYTLHYLLDETSKTRVISWLTRFSGCSCFIPVTFYLNYMILSSGTHSKAVTTVQQAFLSGALIVIVDMTSELRSGPPPFFAHHIFTVVAVLLSAEWGQFELGIVLPAIQLALDKTVWPLFFIARLRSIREKALNDYTKAIQREEEQRKIEADGEEESLKNSDNKGIFLSNTSAESCVSSSLCQEREQPTQKDHHDLTVSQNEPISAVCVEEEANTAEVPEVNPSTEDDQLEVASQTLKIEDAPLNDEQLAAPKTATTSSSFLIQIPDESLFKKAMVYKYFSGEFKAASSSSSSNNNDGEEVWYVDDLIPSLPTLARWYSFAFVYYLFIIRGATVACLLVYLARFWSSLSLGWLIALPFVGFFFVVVDFEVYRQLWRRSHWGGGANPKHALERGCNV